jgi:MFS family permease
LTHLTYAVMANYAVDAALAVALANTLFFAAASAESTGKVLLYLLITVAPFAVIAPFIGPMLDRIQSGRRVALAVCSFGRSLLAIVMAFNFDSWLLYPCALGMMVLSKSFGVLKAALTPRVLPEQITLVKTNSRLTVFGLVAGGVAGAIAAGFAAVSNSSGALAWTALCGVAGGVLCLRIPAWVESTAGEVPVHHSDVLERNQRRFPPVVSATLWANVANRLETGFLALFIAFVVKTEYSHVTGFNQLLLLGIVGVAAGTGGFLGNALGAKITLVHPERVAWIAVLCVAVTTLVAMLMPGLAMGAVVGLIGSTSSSLAKVCLDSVLQHELPEASRASAFGISESALQLAWVFGGVVGLLLGGVLHLKGDPVYTLGFGVVTVLVVLGLIQSWLVRNGRTMVPAISVRSLFRPGSSSPTRPIEVSDTGMTDRYDAETTAGGPAATRAEGRALAPRKAGSSRPRRAGKPR